MKKWSLMSVVLILIFVVVVWVMSEKSESYSTPQEALLATDHNLLLIPGYKLNNKALFFFIKNTNGLGAANVQKGLFGWKINSLTWSPMDNERSYEKLNGYQVHAGNLIYGLIRNGDERLVQIGENDATILDLSVILQATEVEKFRLKGLFIWYFENDTPLDRENIKLLNKKTGEELDTDEWIK